MMTLEEAIKAEKAETLAYEECLNSLDDNMPTDMWNELNKSLGKQMDYHRQLAEWLKALKEIWDSGDCNDCRNGQCEWRPKLGQLVRFNCPHYVGVANEEVNADEPMGE